MEKVRHIVAGLIGIMIAAVMFYFFSPPYYNLTYQWWRIGGMLSAVAVFIISITVIASCFAPELNPEPEPEQEEKKKAKKP